jgi:transcriptional regulator with XRE-family HTH domain
VISGEPRTYGDQVRARRLELGLFQREAAEMIGVDECSVYNWESSRAEPAVRLVPHIIRFLGYCPYDPAPSTEEWLRLIRKTMGLSQEGIAKRVGVDESTWKGWEAGRRRPSAKYRGLIVAFLESLKSASS